MIEWQQLKWSNYGKSITELTISYGKLAEIWFDGSYTESIKPLVVGKDNVNNK